MSVVDVVEHIEHLKQSEYLVSPEQLEQFSKELLGKFLGSRGWDKKLLKHLCQLLPTKSEFVTMDNVCVDIDLYRRDKFKYKLGVVLGWSGLYFAINEDLKVVFLEYCSGIGDDYLSQQYHTVLGDYPCLERVVEIIEEFATKKDKGDNTLNPVPDL